MHVSFCITLSLFKAPQRACQKLGLEPRVKINLRQIKILTSNMK